MEQDAWYQCQDDGDCVVANGICGRPVAVNRKYEKDFVRFALEKGKEIFCSDPTPKWLAWRKRVRARCVDGRCTLYDPQPPNRPDGVRAP